MGWGFLISVVNIFREVTHVSFNLGKLLFYPTISDEIKLEHMNTKMNILRNTNDAFEIINTNK